MQGTLIYSHGSGLTFEIERYQDFSTTKMAWRHRYRQRDAGHDWSNGWHHMEDCVAAIDDAHVDLLPRDDDPPWFACAIVMHDKSYGGPEEGGWYYDTYEPQIGPDVPTPAVFKTRAEAEAWCDDQTLWCQGQNEARHPPSSTISDGHYATMIYEGEFPCTLPKERPHYE